MSKEVNTSILGTFEGECADSTITNLNGIDITREVWENVFNSEEYKKALKNGFYIGYLGHPEDPDCQDFEHACIVMTECNIDDNGKIQGKFNLVDTPVGNIVKKFIDAGVKFGISVRGAGDIYGQSVDPDTFVFRGFDLVTFPAYPDAIPVYKSIAASSDLKVRQKYVAACKAIKSNIDTLYLPEVEVLKDCFAPQSEEYALLEDKCCELTDNYDTETCDDEDIDSIKEQLEAMTNLYLESQNALAEAEAELADIKDKNFELATGIREIKCSTRREINSIRRITSSQMDKLQAELDRANKKVSIMSATNLRLKDSISKSQSENSELTRKVKQLNQIKIEASTEINNLKNEISEMSESNLLYKQRIEATNNDAADKDAIVASLQEQLAKTVDNVDSISEKASDLDEENKQLRVKINATEKLLSQYQKEYAKLYSNTIGTQYNSRNISITASVETLKRDINSASSYSNIITDDVNTQMVSEDIIPDTFNVDEYDLVTL